MTKGQRIFFEEGTACLNAEGYETHQKDVKHFFDPSAFVIGQHHAKIE